MASLTIKHLFGLMVINTASVQVVETTTVQHLKKLGLVYERQGTYGVTPKGKSAIQKAVESVNANTVQAPIPLANTYSLGVA